MKYELIGSPIAPDVQQCISLLLYQKIPFQYTPLSGESLPDWYLQISPLGHAPALVLDEEIVLVHNDVILGFLSDIGPHRMLPAEPLPKAQYTMWIHWAQHILKIQHEWLSSPDQGSFLQKTNNFFQYLRPLERRLGQDFFGGSNITLVDIAWTPIFSRLQFVENRFLLENYWRRQSGFHRWFQSLINQDWVQHSTPKNFDELFSSELFRSNRAWICSQEKLLALG